MQEQLRERNITVGVFGHLLLAAGLAVFSLLVAVGVCVTDMHTGEAVTCTGKTWMALYSYGRDFQSGRQTSPRGRRTVSEEVQLNGN